MEMSALPSNGVGQAFMAVEQVNHGHLYSSPQQSGECQGGKFRSDRGLTMFAVGASGSVGAIAYKHFKKHSRCNVKRPRKIGIVRARSFPDDGSRPAMTGPARKRRDPASYMTGPPCAIWSGEGRTSRPTALSFDYDSDASSFPSPATSPMWKREISWVRRASRTPKVLEKNAWYQNAISKSDGDLVSMGMRTKSKSCPDLSDYQEQEVSDTEHGSHSNSSTPTIQLPDIDAIRALITEETTKMTAEVIPRIPSLHSRATVSTLVDDVPSPSSISSDSDELSLRQIKEVMLYAFNTFDSNNDGRMSLEDFNIAIHQLGINASDSKVKLWFERLDADNDGYISSSMNKSSVETWYSAFEAAMKKQAKRKGIDKVSLLGESIHSGFDGIQNPLDWAKAAVESMFKHADQLADVLEAGLDAAAIALALQVIGKEFGGVETLSEVDAENLVPIALFLGMSFMHMNKEVSPTEQDMTGDEAMLYVRSFKPHGFSPSEFKTMLQEVGGEWTEVLAGTSLKGDQDKQLVMVARGGFGVHVKNVVEPVAELGPGATIGDTAFLTGQELWRPGQLVATPNTLCVYLDFSRLREYMDKDSNASKRMGAVLAKSMGENRTAVQAAIESEVQQSPTRRRFQRQELVAATDAESMRLVLEAAYDEADSWKTGMLDAQGVRTALLRVDELQGYGISAAPAIVDRLVDLITAESGGLPPSKDSFVTSMQKLADGLEGLGQISLRQLREILACALERFDLNGDMKISLEEFFTALAMLGLELSDSAAETLFSMLDLDGDGFIDPSDDLAASNQNDGVELGRLFNAFEAAIQTQYKRKPAGRVTNKLQQMDLGSLLKSQQSWASLFEEMCSADTLHDIVDTSVDAISMIAALDVVRRSMVGVDSLDDLDFCNVAPLIVFLGLSGVHLMQELSKQEVRHLTEDEALLYVRFFQSHGFSRSEFSQLLKHGGATLVDYSRTRSGSIDLPKDDLSFIIRGACTISSSLGTVSGLGVGATIGETSFLTVPDSPISCSYKRQVSDSNWEIVVPAGGVRLISWNAAKLKRYLALNEGAANKLNDVLVEAAAAKLLAVQNMESTDFAEPRKIYDPRKTSKPIYDPINDPRKTSKPMCKEGNERLSRHSRQLRLEVPIQNMTSFTTVQSFAAA